MKNRSLMLNSLVGSLILAFCTMNASDNTPLQAAATDAPVAQTEQPAQSETWRAWAWKNGKRGAKGAAVVAVVYGVARLTRQTNWVSQNIATEMEYAKSKILHALGYHHGCTNRTGASNSALTSKPGQSQRPTSTQSPLGNNSQTAGRSSVRDRSSGLGDSFVDIAPESPTETGASPKATTSSSASRGVSQLGASMDDRAANTGRTFTDGSTRYVSAGTGRLAPISFSTGRGSGRSKAGSYDADNY